MYTIQDLKQGDKFQHNDIVITITYQGNVGDALVFINNYNNVDIRTLQEINDNYTKLEEPKKEPSKIAIHTPTLKEFMYVAEKIGSKTLSKVDFNDNKANTCIDFEIVDGSVGDYSYLDWYKDNNFTIISFEYWCKQNGHDGLPKLIQGFEVGDYSSKPLLLEVSADGEFNDGIFESIIRIKDSIEPFIDIDGYSWKFARKIDTSKYII